MCKEIFSFKKGLKKTTTKNQWCQKSQGDRKTRKIIILLTRSLSCLVSDTIAVFEFLVITIRWWYIFSTFSLYNEELMFSQKNTVLLCILDPQQNFKLLLHIYKWINSSLLEVSCFVRLWSQTKSWKSRHYNYWFYYYY